MTRPKPAGFAISIKPISRLAKRRVRRHERGAGEMAEWLKAHAWKACIRETVSWVRIPLSPPVRRTNNQLGDSMSDEDMKAELERLRSENAALKKVGSSPIRLKVSEKGALSVYGMG